LVIDPNAVCFGTVTSCNAFGAAYASTLELASAGKTGGFARACNTDPAI
jgi:hypothetical protein